MFLNPDKVQIFLKDKIQSEITNLLPVKGGEWSQAFLFTVKGKNKIIRFSQTDEDFLKDKYAFRYNSAQLPVPEIEAFGKAFGGYYAISSHIEGKMIDHLNSEEMQKLLPHLFDLFNALRQTDVSDTNGYGGWDAWGQGANHTWKEFLSNVNQDDATNRINWRPKLESLTDAYLLFQKVYSQMQQLLVYCPEDRYLIHNDLLHFNLLIANNKAAGVIDWGCSLYGDFVYDLAMFDLWQFYYPSMQGINFPKEAIKYYKQQGVYLVNFEERLKCYQCHLALDAIKYCAYKENTKDLALIVKRIKNIIA